MNESTEDYLRGLKDGATHQSPSQETLRMFDNVDKKLDEHTHVHNQILDRVEKGFDKVISRQDIANGRTNKNELKIAQAVGGLAVLSAILLPILTWALYTLVNIDKQVQVTLEHELSTYEFEISK